MTLYQLAYWLNILFDMPIYEIEGYLFLDIQERGEQELRNRIEKSTSISGAQTSINGLLIEGFIDDIVGDDWEFDGPPVETILSVLENALTYKIKTKYPDAAFWIERNIDPEINDLRITLRQA